MTPHLTSKLPLDLVLKTDAGEAHAVEVLDLRCTGVWARFPRKGDVIADGELVRLTLHSAALPEPMNLLAVVQSREEEHDSRCYNFEFPAQSFDQERAGPLFAQANRRGAYRVQPHSEESIPMQVSTQGGEFLADGTIDCLSASGLGIVVSDDDEVSFVPDDLVVVRLTLPSSEPELCLPATVRTRRRWTGRMRYGLEIDTDLMLNPELAAEEITAYVFGRQRQIAQGRSVN